MLLLRGFLVTTLALAGCATQSTPIEPQDPPASEPGSPTPGRPGATARMATPPRGAHAPRVGIEFVLPEDTSSRGLAGGPTAWLPPTSLGGPAHAVSPDGHDPIVIESVQPEVAPAMRRAGTPNEAEDRRPDLPWTMSTSELAGIENPAERFTLQFLHHVLGEERRGVQRNIPPLILFSQGSRRAAPHNLESHLDRRDREDQQLLVAREARRMLRKPLQRALRDSTIVRDIEVVFDEFKADHLPLTTTGDEVRDDDVDWGRVSVRVRASRLDDPLEVTYVRSGLRFGGGPQRLKASYRLDLTDRLNVGVRANYVYQQGEFDVWGDLYWRLHRDAHLHVLAGSRIDLLTGSQLLPLVQSPVVLEAADVSPGVMFYVEHVF